MPTLNLDYLSLLHEVDGWTLSLKGITVLELIQAASAEVFKVSGLITGLRLRLSQCGTAGKTHTGTACPPSRGWDSGR